MTVNAINPSDRTSSSAPVASLQSQPPSTTESAAPAAQAVGEPAPRISGPGQLFSRLQELLQKDPAKFKEVMQHISDELRTSAGQSSGKTADLEGGLADHFAAAAQSGDLSSLARPASKGGGDGPRGAHHHHDRSARGNGGPLQAIFSSALDEVNKALEASHAPSPETPAAPAADASSGS